MGVLDVTLTRMHRPLASLAMLAWIAASAVAAPAETGDTAGLLARIAQRLEQYFARAQSIICRETVQLQMLRYDLTWDGSHVRKLVYELRVAWTPSTTEGKPPDATVLRELVSIDGRTPSLSKDTTCLDPKAVSPEPLTMLLASRQAENVFTWAGSRRSSSGSTAMLDYRPVKRQTPDATFTDDCVSVDLPGWWRGRVWIDQETAAVTRIDEHLTGAVELPIPKHASRNWFPLSSIMFNRVDSSIRYRSVAFHDPDETLMLPESFEVVQSGHNRLRTIHTFSDYRRFITAGRIVAAPELQ
jgi:hypothetical protein